MKKDIHPAYTAEATITCACGNSFTVGSTNPDIRIELCSACHPFYTGKQKLVDTARRVEKFEEKMARVASAAGLRKGKKVKRAAAKAKKEDAKPKAGKKAKKEATAKEAK